MSTIFETTSTAKGGRNGHIKSEDGIIDMDVRIPEAMGGEGGAYSNPEQLFSAGYAACFDSAIQFVAGSMKKEVTSETTVTIGVVKTPDGLGLSASIKANIEGVEKETAQEILDKAHATCPYSKATKGNIEQNVELI